MSRNYDRRRFIKVAALVAAPFLLPSAVQASGKRIAVIVEGDESTTQGDIGRFEARIGGGVIRGRATLVSRHRLNAILQEQGFSNSQYADPSTAASLGKILGASHILWSKLSVEIDGQDGEFVSKLSVSASADYELISVSTARILSTGTADGSDDTESAAGGQVSGGQAARRNAIDTCADDLISQVTL